MRRAATRSFVIFGAPFNMAIVSRGGIIRPTGGLIRLGGGAEDHWRWRTFGDAVTDALAMNLNDFAVSRAIPVEICDHIFVPQDDHGAIACIVYNLVVQCVDLGIAITGGETAIHEGMKGLEISITMRGIKRSCAPNLFQAGDALVGIASSGAHANGYTKIHHVLDIQEFLPESITTPTLIYHDAVDGVDRVCGIHGMTHITGGAFTKIKKFLCGNDAHIHRDHGLVPHDIFWQLVKKGVPEREMYCTFNCGIGFVIGIHPSMINTCLSILRQRFNADVIGEVKSGTGMVHMQSMFSHMHHVL